MALGMRLGITLGLVLAAFASGQDPACSSGIKHPDGVTCCSRQCGSLCGAVGCSVNPSNCCSSAIRQAAESCTSVDAPCVRPSCAATNGTVSTDGTICCSRSCGGACGGTGCSTKPGGPDQCCTGVIRAANKTCAAGNAPCVLKVPVTRDPQCVTGILHPDGLTCCAASCGATCGARDCSANGAAGLCCQSSITRSCDSNLPPCVRTPTVKRPVSIGVFDGHGRPGDNMYPAREAQYGFKFDHILRYQRADSLNYGVLAPIIADGHEVILNIEFWTPVRNIVAGQFDDELRAFAAQVAHSDRSMRIRTLHEANGSWYPWALMTGGGYEAVNTLADYTLAWQRIIGIFRESGARIRWQLNYNFRNALGSQRPFTDFTPTAVLPEIETIGISVYNFAFLNGRDYSESFISLVSNAYNQLSALSNKQEFIAEMGSISGAPTGNFVDKADWIRRAWYNMAVRLPRVTEITWFLFNKVENGLYHDWDLNSPQEVEAFVEGYQLFKDLTT